MILKCRRNAANRLTIMLATGVTTLVLVLTLTNSALSNDAVWSWECTENQCLKVRSTNSETAVSLGACRMFCNPHGPLWPRVHGNLHLGDKLVHINVNSIDVLPKNGETPSGDLVTKAGARFKENIEKMIPRNKNLAGGKSLEVVVDIAQPNVVALTLETDESYALNVTTTSDGRINANIKAPTFFGARHGLETLSQLVIYDDIRDEIQLAANVQIEDKPIYPYRGLLLDTARNYFKVDSIKRTLEGMASSKLNSFHWHITDSQSFPFVSKSNPSMYKLGAYAPSKIYTAEDIKEIIEFAKIRGIRVIPEFDAPAHVGEGWQDTDLVACFNAQPWNQYCVEPPCGQLDPTKPELYNILEGIYGDMAELFQPELFHMGGDEVSLSCWNSTTNIVNWMQTQKWDRSEADFMKLWNHFQTKALEKLNKKLNKKIPIVMWTSTLTKTEYVDQYLPKDDYIIQIWAAGYDPIVRDLLKKGYRLILSNYDALYLDCGFEAWVSEGNNWCSPYIGWQKVYNNLPSKLAGKEKHEQVLGSESALWSEQVDDTTIDSRLWPRAAAMAETLWAEPTEGWRAAENRMLIQRNRLVERGIQASGMQPEWCLQHQGQCPTV